MDDSQTRLVGLEDDAKFEASVIADPTSVELEPADQEQTTSEAADDERPAAAEPDEQEPAWVGKVLGHFKLLRTIGEGAMGRVIQAEDIHLGRIVALKVLRKQIRGMPEVERVKQFLREARAATRIDHPNIVPIYEINSYGGWWVIAMEMLEGGTVQSIVRAIGPLPPVRACPIVADGATGLAAAHQAGVIHRDIKPANLMLTRTGRCKLTDFGLVRLDDPNDPFDFTNRLLVGTPQYMAPEVILRRTLTPAADVYGLGGTLYFALTGSVPFPGKDSQEIFQRHVKDPPPDPREKCPDCPDTLAKLVQRAMAKDPTERPSSADMAVALRAESIGTAIEPAHPLASGSGSWVAMPSPTPSHATDARWDAGSWPAESSPAGRPRGGSVTAPAPARPVWQSLLAAGSAVALVLILIVLIGRLGLLQHGHSPSDGAEGVRQPPAVALDADQLRADLAARFPAAPETYGLLPAHTIPLSTLVADKPPQFSWVGKVDAEGVQFVAGRKGRHYFRIDDPLAVLITRDNFVGYRTAAQAEADGKLPLP